MSKGKISVVIKNTVPPANDKLSQQWQKVENSLTTRLFLVVPRLLSQSHVQSINEPLIFFSLVAISFHFISRPCLLASRRAMIDYIHFLPLMYLCTGMYH